MSLRKATIHRGVAMDVLQNLAGKPDCDIQIEMELKEAGIHYQDRIIKSHGEVESKILAHYHGWTFERAWCYWVASTETTPLLFKFADDLHSKHGKYVRVAGHCGCPSPREWFKDIWDIGVNNYHIDTQEGLNAFVDYIEDQTTSW